jgi:hypothetical protein
MINTVVITLDNHQFAKVHAHYIASILGGSVVENPKKWWQVRTRYSVRAQNVSAERIDATKRFIVFAHLGNHLTFQVF